MAENDKNFARNIEWEIARIRNFPSTVDDSVTFEMRGGDAALSFQICTDPLLDGESAASINDIEPICFLYGSADQIGKKAPVTLSERDDFPRDLSHLNPGEKELPANLCLSRTNIQVIYDRFGIVGILDRLSNWLSDAKSGILYEDGWEPVPMPPTEGGVVGSIDPKRFQLLAAQSPTGGARFICARFRHLHGENFTIDAARSFLDTSDSEILRKTRIQMSTAQGDETDIPAIFCWPDSKTKRQKPFFNQWTDINSLIDGLKETSLWDHAEESTIKMNVLFKDQDEKAVPPDFLFKNRRCGFLLIVGLWRPLHIDRSVGGLAENDDLARSLELRAYFISRDRDQEDHWHSSAKVEPFHGFTPVNSDTLRAVSGEDPMGDLLFFGAGALGSNLVDHAARSGVEKMKVVDQDIFLPHNTARHIGNVYTVGVEKAELSAKYADAVNRDISVTSARVDVLSLTDKEFADEIEEHSSVIDATANPQVRIRLSKSGIPKRQLFRSEIFNQGRLGVTMATQTDSPITLNFLHHWLISQSSTIQNVKDWISYEATGNFRDHELLLGFGCQSFTTKLPNYKLSVHASAAYAAIRSHVSTSNAPPAVYLNEIDEAGLPRGTNILLPGEVVVFHDAADTDGWRVIVPQNVLEKMHAMRAQKAPDETGGYLYGAISEDNSELYVLFISTEPPGTKGSPTHLALGICGRTGEERAFLRRTGRRLPPIGTWHSHPSGAPAASKTDWKTLDRFLETDAAHAMPTFMLISGAQEDRAYVKDNRA